MSDDTDQLREKRICADCVGEVYLKDLVAAGTEGECDYCGGTGPSFSLEEMADCIETCFDQHFTRTYEDRFERNDGEPIIWAIANVASIEEEPAKDIQQILAEAHAQFGSDWTGEPTPFDDESTYAERAANDWHWQSEWRKFEKSLKTESRYFSQAASEHLASIFAGIEEMQTASGQSVIVTAGPGTDRSHFYRARYFESDARLEEAMERPDLHLGPPPADVVMGGRMNARGISVFYGADSRETALAEVRPPVGSRVLVAKFDLVRPLRLLDLKALAEISVAGSVFDPTYAPKVERAKFLEYLLHRVTMPVMPSQEGLDYLATQAVADFLASRESPALDGILYPSVQVAQSSQNVVLFQKSSRMSLIEIPKDATFHASVGEQHEEGWETYYEVFEELPKPTAADAAPAQDFPSFPASLSLAMDVHNGDARAPTLSVDLENVEVREVSAVSFTTSNYGVTRRRWTPGDIPF